MPLKSEISHTPTKLELIAQLQLELADITDEMNATKKKIREGLANQSQSVVEARMLDITVEFIKRGEPIREALKRLLG